MLSPSSAISLLQPPAACSPVAAPQYAEPKFARHFGKLGLDMPRAGLVPPPTLLRESSSAELASAGFVWQFESREGWVSFGASDQTQLEAALATGDLNPTFGGRRFNLQEMAQTNVNSKKKRNLRRVPSSATPRSSMHAPTSPAERGGGGGSSGEAAGGGGEQAHMTVPNMRLYTGQTTTEGTLQLFPTKGEFCIQNDEFWH